MSDDETGGKKRQERELPPQQRETLISFNDANGIAVIHTHNRNWQRHLEKGLGIEPKVRDGDGGCTYEIAKKRIKLPEPPERLSTEDKKSISAYLQAPESAIETCEDTLCGVKPKKAYGPYIRD